MMDKLNTMTDVLFVRPVNKRNGITLSAVGALLLSLAFWLFVSFPQGFAPGLVLFTFGAISLILGVSKLGEPEISFELSQSGLLFRHRKGQFYVDWDNIQRMDIPRVTQGVDIKELPYIGIKLRQINPVLDSISPRLATGLVSEQRPLLMTATTQTDDLGKLEDQLSAEFTPFESNGDRYRGVLAMFGHRCELLSDTLGFHLFLPQDSMDRDAAEFLAMLKEFRARAPQCE